jgi:hypothetical protein
MPDEPTSELTPQPEPANWHTFKLRKLTVATSAINSKYCRVSELGEGFLAIEVEGLEPVVNEEPFAIAQVLAEKMAHAGAVVRRVTSADGAESYV